MLFATVYYVISLAIIAALTYYFGGDKLDFTAIVACIAYYESLKKEA